MPRTKGAKPLTLTVRQRLYDLIFTKHEHGLTDNQIAAQLGISRTTVRHYRMAWLKQHPHLKEHSRGRVEKHMEAIAASGAPKPDIDVQAAAAAVDSLSEIAEKKGGGPPLAALLKPAKSVLSVDEMLRVLSNLATSGPPQYRVQAVKLLDELQQQHRPVESLGPPEPKTEDEMSERLAELMTALPMPVVTKALERIGYAAAS